MAQFLDTTLHGHLHLMRPEDISIPSAQSLTPSKIILHSDFVIPGTPNNEYEYMSIGTIVNNSNGLNIIGNTLIDKYWLNNTRGYTTPNRLILGDDIEFYSYGHSKILSGQVPYSIGSERFYIDKDGRYINTYGQKFKSHKLAWPSEQGNIPSGTVSIAFLKGYCEPVVTPYRYLDQYSRIFYTASNSSNVGNSNVYWLNNEPFTTADSSYRPLITDLKTSISPLGNGLFLLSGHVKCKEAAVVRPAATFQLNFNFNGSGTVDAGGVILGASVSNIFYGSYSSSILKRGNGSKQYDTSSRSWNVSNIPQWCCRALEIRRTDITTSDQLTSTLSIVFFPVTDYPPFQPSAGRSEYLASNGFSYSVLLKANIDFANSDSSSNVFSNASFEYFEPNENFY